MKRKSIKTIGLILAAALMLTILLTACSSQNEPNNPEQGGITAGGGSPGTSDSESADDSAEAEAYKIPDADFDGYVMRLVTISNEDWAIPELDVEEETGEPVNDAIYRRNRQIETGLNIVMQEIPAGIQSHENLRRSVMANADEYDLMFAHASSGGPIASLGYYVNLYDIATLNLDQPYWDQGAIKSFELMNKLYFTTSDACLMTNDAIWVIYFNKKIIQDMGLEDPYQLVRDNKWTADAMYKMARDAAKDIDGDGIFTGADQWGITSHSLSFIEFLNCMGEQLVKKDNDGYPFLITPGDRFISAYSKVRNLTSSSNGVFLDAFSNFPGKTSELGHPSTIFMNDRALFCAEVLGWSRRFREMTADFGILPHPKFDENQPTYLNATANTVPIVAIPITNPNPERTGVFIDALTALSATTVTPAYYTISLEGKFTRDEDSIEMLDIIRSNRIYDLAVIYNWNNFFSSVISHGMSANGDNPVTVFERHGERVETQIANTIAAFEEIN
jgi:hypothetical protein